MEKIVGVEVLASAEAELLEAISYYNEQSEGLGFDLAAEVLRTIERIVHYPDCISCFTVKPYPAAYHSCTT